MRTVVDSRDGAARRGDDFPDAILAALLRAQAMWMATRDPAALRREVIAILAALGWRRLPTEPLVTVDSTPMACVDDHIREPLKLSPEESQGSAGAAR